MQLTFVQQIEAAARRITRRRWATAACWAFAAVVAALLGVILLDWLLGVYHTVGRILLTALLLTTVVSIYRWVTRSARGRTMPLSVALELERLYPEHQGLLASGLEFSRQEADDATAGSFDLRRAAVLRASMAVESIDLAAAMPREPLRRALAAAIAATLVLALPAALAPQTFAIGVARLLNPLSDAEWPRRHDLAFVDPPELIPAGSDFVTLLRDRNGTLPQSVEVEFRTRRQGRWQYESQTYAASGEAIEIRRPNVQRSFEYRARGGDHKSMAWQRVETAPAPQISSLRLTARPPAYTGLPEEKLSEPIRVLAGTTLALQGAASRAIESARLEADGETGVPLTLGDDGRTFGTAAVWRPKSTADWSIVFTTAEGMTAVADRRLFVEVAPDLAPTMEIVDPTQDLAVLPEAKIDIAVTADDDLAVKAVRLVVTSVSLQDKAPIWIPLYEGGEQSDGDPRRIRYPLELSSLAPRLGTHWEVVAQASDYAGQEATGVRPLRLRIISRDEFIQRVNGLTARLATTLERSLAIQRESRTRVGELLGEPSASYASAIASAALLQRQVGQSIAGSPESAVQLAEILAAEYRRNRWPDVQALARIESLFAVLNGLAINQLAAAEETLTHVARAAQSSPDFEELRDRQREALSTVRVRQDEVIGALEAMIRDLSRASEIQRFHRDLAELKREQAELLNQTEALAREALLNPGKSTSQQRQARQQAIDSQRRLVGSLAATLGRMKLSAADLAISNPADAQRLEAAVAAAEQSQLQGRIREAADQLAAARLGQATSAQRAVIEHLQQALDRMNEGGDRAAADRLAALMDAEQELEAIRREVAALTAEQLPRAARPMAEQTKQLAEELEQIRADAAAQSAREAAKQLEGDPSPESGRSARQKLEDAQQQLAAERRRQETLLSKLKVEQLDAALGRLIATQQAVVEQTITLQNRRDAKGGLAPADEQAARGLAEEQAEVQQQSLAQAEVAAPFPVFARLLQTAADTMGAAAERLDAADVGDETLDVASRALDELHMLAAAVRQQRQQQSQSPQAEQQRPSAPNQQQGEPTDPDRVQKLQLAVAQLGLLRNMQVDLEEQTAGLERKAASAGIHNEALRERSKELARQQRELAELAESLVQELAQSPAGDENNTEAE